MYYQNQMIIQLKLYPNLNMYKMNPEPCNIILKTFPTTNRLPSSTVTQICRTDNYGVTQISNGRWNQLNLNVLSEQIQDWEATSLDLVANQQKDIIKHIENIRFASLQSLDLKLNRIQTIEKITNLYAPNLKVLSLQSNQCCKIRSLRKSYFPSLRQAKFVNMKILDLESIFEADWPHLQRLYFEWFFGINLANDLSFVAKLSSQNIINICIQHPKRITNYQVLAALKSKHLLIRFQTFLADTNAKIKQIIKRKSQR